MCCVDDDSHLLPLRLGLLISHRVDGFDVGLCRVWCGVPLENKSGRHEEETTTTALSLSLSVVCVFVRVVFLALSQDADVRFEAIVDFTLLSSTFSLLLSPALFSLKLSRALSSSSSSTSSSLLN